MRRAILSFALVAPVIVAGSGGTAQAETASVTITDVAFAPATAPVQMAVGEPGLPASHAHVVWTVTDPVGEHTVTFDDPVVVSSGSLRAGQRHEALFSSPGTFAYRCTIHPAMTGTVVVSPPPAGSGAPPPASTPGAEEATQDDGSGSPVVALVLGVSVVAVAAALCWFLLRRRRPASPAGS